MRERLETGEIHEPRNDMRPDGFYTPFKKGKDHINYGKPPPNKGKKFPHTKEWEEKRIAEVRAAAKKRGFVPTGRPPTEKVKLALREWHQENRKKSVENAINNLPKNVNGSKNGNWKGGITVKQRGIRFTQEYRNWRNSVLDRDGRKCRECGTIEKLEVHHIIPMSLCREITLLRMNGVTLCKKCHFKNDKAWQGERFKQMSGGIGTTLALMFTIPHKFHEYPTVGNWQFTPDGKPVIFISEEIGDKYALFVGIHELIEMIICRRYGITQDQVDKFDIEFEKTRKAGDDSEPGDHHDCPYKHPHKVATFVERMLVILSGDSWTKYEKTINALP